MFSSFFEGTQQDWKIMIVAPVICAVFRLAFIWVYASDKGFNGCRKNGMNVFVMVSGGAWITMPMCF